MMNWSHDGRHGSGELVELDAGSEVVVMRLIGIYRVNAGDSGKGLLLRGMFPPRSKK